MTIFYHGDMDGIVAANLYIRHCVSIATRIELVKFEYENQGSIIEYTKAYSQNIRNVNTAFIFLDCCPDEDVIEALLKKHIVITIIDHHISKKETVDKFLQEGLISGISYIGASATLITWSWIKFAENIQDITYFLDKTKNNRKEQDKEIPITIKLINSWDIWNNMYPDAEPYKIYFEAQDFIPSDDKIKELLENSISIRNAIRDGYTMMQFHHNWGGIYCKRYGYEVKYKTNNFFVLNIGNASSKIFGDLINNYDAVITYCNDGTMYKCSIYSVKEDFDCSKFAEKFGGGGHKGAAGFSLDKLPLWLRGKKNELDSKGEDEIDTSEQRGKKRKTK